MTNDTIDQAAQDASTKRIRELNDATRCSADFLGTLIARGQWIITRGVADKGTAFIDRAVKAVREFSDFNPDNDPYGEHDCALFDLDGEQLMFKIDYYDGRLEHGSEDPSDASATRRVLTILLAEEY